MPKLKREKSKKSVAQKLADKAKKARDALEAESFNSIKASLATVIERAEAASELGETSLHLDMVVDSDLWKAALSKQGMEYLSNEANGFTVTSSDRLAIISWGLRESVEEPAPEEPVVELPPEPAAEEPSNEPVLIEPDPEAPEAELPKEV